MWTAVYISPVESKEGDQLNIVMMPLKLLRKAASGLFRKQTPFKLVSMVN
jgi:hypothetical protein